MEEANCSARMLCVLAFNRLPWSESSLVGWLVGRLSVGPWVRRLVCRRVCIYN